MTKHTVGQIFDYETAIKALEITETEIINSSALPIYVKVDGEPIIVEANSSYKF